MTVPYESSFEEGERFLYAKVVGERTPENVLRFFGEVREARERLGHSAVLLHMNLTGPTLGIGGIYSVASQGSRTAVTLKRIAYVEGAVANPEGPGFAATVAANRGVNIRLFDTVPAAIDWLLHG